ncbi:cotton fiber protein [Perilla frutescens var. hirtella]|nr:cotton fiber protein [Perilla frutescens var. frutescens]KAH6801350.1 cotton fiber protein [Perilla frutescens var. hirtella]
MNYITIKQAPFFKSSLVDEEEEGYPRKKPAAEGHREAAEKAAAPPQKGETKPTEDINASAEAFIKRFRQQLHLQKMESMEKNYDQNIKRGVY